jgi:hypothetical protein
MKNFSQHNQSSGSVELLTSQIQSKNVHHLKHNVRYHVSMCLNGLQTNTTSINSYFNVLTTDTPWLTLHLHSGRYSISSTSRKSELSIHVANYVCIEGGLVKSKVQHIGISSALALPPCHLCYYPEVFFHHLSLIVLSLPQGKIWRMFKKWYYFNFYLFNNLVCLKLHNLRLCRWGSVCNYSKCDNMELGETLCLFACRALTMFWTSKHVEKKLNFVWINVLLDDEVMINEQHLRDTASV